MNTTTLHLLFTSHVSSILSFLFTYIYTTPVFFIHLFGLLLGNIPVMWHTYNVSAIQYIPMSNNISRSTTFSSNNSNTGELYQLSHTSFIFVPSHRQLSLCLPTAYKSCPKTPPTPKAPTHSPCTLSWCSIQAYAATSSSWAYSQCACGFTAALWDLHCSRLAKHQAQRV